MTEQLTEAVELVHPETGEVIDAADVDAMASAYEAARRKENELYAFRRMLAERLAVMTTGESKTRRLRGQATRVKIEMPDDSWNNSLLKELWNSYPQLAVKYLRIERIGPQLREVKKLKNESGDVAFQMFKSIMLKANEGPRGTPKITIEEASDTTTELIHDNLTEIKSSFDNI